MGLCGGIFYIMWWDFLHTVVDTHYCGRLLCLVLWVIKLDGVVFLCTVVDTHYCSGLLCLMWSDLYAKNTTTECQKYHHTITIVLIQPLQFFLVDKTEIYSHQKTKMDNCFNSLIPFDLTLGVDLSP